MIARTAHQHRAAKAVLDEAIAAGIDRLWRPAMDVAQETADPIGQILATVLARDPRPDIVGAVQVLLPESTVSLRELAVVAAQASVAIACQGGEPGVIAGALNNLSNRLAELGQREEALAAIQEAAALT